LTSDSQAEDLAATLLSLKMTSNAKLTMKFLDKKTKAALAELVASLQKVVGTETQFALASEFGSN
jgi:hypothetical protein